MVLIKPLQQIQHRHSKFKPTCFCVLTLDSGLLQLITPKINLSLSSFCPSLRDSSFLSYAFHAFIFFLSIILYASAQRDSSLVKILYYFPSKFNHWSSSSTPNKLYYILICCFNYHYYASISHETPIMPLHLKLTLDPFSHRVEFNMIW